MDQIIPIITGWGKLYNFSFFKWRYAPIKFILTEKVLIIKYWGIFKVREINYLDIIELKILDKKWLNKLTPGDLYFSINFLNNPLLIKYNHKSSEKTDYIVASLDDKKKIFEFISKRIK